MMLHKLLANYGHGALRVLGPGGYARYLAASMLATPGILARRDLRPVDRAMHGTIALRHPLNGNQLRMDLDAYRPGDDAEGTYAFGLVREIWFRDVYLGQFELPPAIDCVIDLGANRGVFALQACSFARSVIAVEALDRYHEPLRHNLELNGFKNLHLVQAFVGSDAFLAAGGHTVLALEEVLAMAAGHAIDFMKIDIEGSEFGLDLSALAQVKRLAMEVHPKWGSTQTLLDGLARLGMNCRLFDDAMQPVDVAHAAFIYAINPRFTDVAWKHRSHTP